ncbi:MAG: hypothetical protein FGM24_02150 [Candidatus Kapabacteria bacterium]|nr:hypothetical protein [Candidatus Kapabacteria bacterium]
MMQLVLIEPDDVRGLWPFSATHGAWELRVGHGTILERWQRVLQGHPVVVTSTRPLVEAGFHERQPGTCAAFAERPTLAISADVALTTTEMRRIIGFLGQTACCITCNGVTVGVYLPTAFKTLDAMQAAIDGLDVESVASVDVEGTVISSMWQVHDVMAKLIRDDAGYLDKHIHPTARVHQMAVIDTRNGPVLIDAEAVVEPLAVIYGPASIGRGCLVKAHSSLRTVALGPVCKVAGEIDTVVLQGYASKQHDGFLGNAYLGEWTNLGAGTIASNLLNTYGNVIVNTPWGRLSTERMFVGLMMGDHSKTAIGTLFTTGTLVGVGANIVVSSFPPQLIRSFVWKDPSTPRPALAKYLATARLVMQRRQQELGPAMTKLLTSIYVDGDA